MAQEFELYDNLLLQSEKIRDDISLSELAPRLAVLPNKHLTLIQALIIHHNYLNGGYEAIPYTGQLLTDSNTSGVKYNMNKLPQSLIKILHAYLQAVTE